MYSDQSHITSVANTDKDISQKGPWILVYQRCFGGLSILYRLVTSDVIPINDCVSMQNILYVCFWVFVCLFDFCLFVRSFLCFIYTDCIFCKCYSKQSFEEAFNIFQLFMSTNKNMSLNDSIIFSIIC
jgi:hypothetical protein